MNAVALTIAGSDPSGGAGLQADLKTFHAHEVYGASVVTLITVQNTQRVSRVDVLSPDVVVQQLRAVVEDVGVSALKTGALGDEAVIRALAPVLASVDVPRVFDPVMVSKHGASLLGEAGVRAFRDALLPLATLLTPNAPEAEVLTGVAVVDVESAVAAGESLRGAGAEAVLVKGGHFGGERAADVLVSSAGVRVFDAPRIVTTAGHGTGCTLSAAITARLARGEALEAAVGASIEWLREALLRAPGIGRGVGPVEHRLRPRLD